MRRRMIITFSVLGLLVVVFAIALGKIGAELDQMRIERDELRYQVDDLQQDVNIVSGERDALLRQVEDQQAATARWKAKVDQMRNARQPTITPSQ
jgi:uncharacterized coiled-coil DUF342 family protein